MVETDKTATSPRVPPASHFKWMDTYVYREKGEELRSWRHLDHNDQDHYKDVGVPLHNHFHLDLSLHHQRSNHLVPLQVPVYLRSLCCS